MRSTVTINMNVGDAGNVTLNTMRDQGFVINQTFEGVVPQMPADITELDDLGVMRLWQEYIAYSEFLLAQITVAQMDEDAAKKKLDLIEAKYMEVHTQPKRTVSAIKALVMAEQEVIDADFEFSVAYNYRQAMDMMYTNAEIKANFISRELTRRTSSSFGSRAGKFTV